MYICVGAGETVTLTRRIDKNWYEGKIGSRKGILPVSYVEIISDLGDTGSGDNLLYLVTMYPMSVNC